MNKMLVFCERILVIVSFKLEQDFATAFNLILELEKPELECSNFGR
jgi:hypothetical protein